MAKATILDRLAGAMETLGKREGKALTPKQRVAAAQRWNSLTDVGEKRMLSADERAASFDPTTAASGAFERDNIQRNLMDMRLVGNDGWTRADNPFLSKNPTKYDEQTKFLAWCRYKGVEPNARNLKRFRWESYQTLPYRERQWIANKDAVRNYMRDNYTLYGQQPPELKTLRDVDEYWIKNVWNGVEPREGYLEYTYPKRQPYSSIEEFPDDFDYMWRY